MPPYIGNNTDEAAFQSIGERGVTILVAEEARDTAAQDVLSNSEEVRQFLERVIEVP